MLARAVLAAALVLASASHSAEPAHAYRAPRTAWGAPNLGGLWTNTTMTPLQRPKAFQSLTVDPSTAAAFVKASREEFDTEEDGVGGRQSEWWDLADALTRIGGAFRTSLIVDPADGQLPYNAAGRRLVREGREAPLQALAGPEARPSPERCLTGGAGSSGVPMLPARNNGNYLLVQTRDEIAIWIETGGLRIIRLGPRSHLPATIRPWMGDSLGRWDGDTLVVETTNLNPGEVHKTPQPISITADARVMERFRRISPTEVLYAFEVDDPAAFTTVWRAELVMRATKGPPYENACHEGNYSLPGVLAGARAEERAASR